MKVLINYMRYDFFKVSNINIKEVERVEKDGFIFLISNRSYFWNSEKNKDCYNEKNIFFIYILDKQNRCSYVGYKKTLEVAVNFINNIDLLDAQKIINDMFNEELQNEIIKNRQERILKTKIERERELKEKLEKQEQKDKEESLRIDALVQKVLNSEEIIVDAEDFEAICKKTNIKLGLRTIGSLRKNVGSVTISGKKVTSYSRSAKSSCKSLFNIEFKGV